MVETKYFGKRFCSHDDDGEHWPLAQRGDAPKAPLLSRLRETEG